MRPVTKHVRPLEVIEKKRDGLELDPAEINAFIQGVAGGSVPDYQAAAWLMAVYLRGMTPAETAALTEAMLHSGRVLDLSDLPGPKVDKHSTGGVGDKVSLIVAPVCAALGVYVPMISGRGLGHTGGTLDKLEAIPGFDVGLDLERFRSVLADTGLALIGQTDEIAPADRALYALRDVTGTVACIPLIAASIMSKKLAEGLDGLVMDVKAGSGAFMPTPEHAAELARAIIDIGRAMGTPTTALVTRMDQPLGRTAGNALEVVECVQVLRNERDHLTADLRELSLALAGHMLALAGAAENPELGAALAETALADGSALERLRRVVAAQAGDARAIDDPGRLPRAAHSRILTAPSRGVLTRCDALAVGRGNVLLGAGRQRKDQAVDPACGVALHAKVGDRLAPGDAVLEIFYNDPDRLEAALPLFTDAIRVEERELRPEPVIVIRVE